MVQVWWVYGIVSMGVCYPAGKGEMILLMHTHIFSLFIFQYTCIYTLFWFNAIQNGYVMYDTKSQHALD